jgi:hypothetical protein
VGDTLYAAAGDAIFALTLPALDLLWASKTDATTCYGVHYASKHDCLVSHGETAIARLSRDGRIGWTVPGKDLFTGRLQLHPDHLVVEDFGNVLHRIDLATGRAEVVTPG